MLLEPITAQIFLLRDGKRTCAKLGCKVNDVIDIVPNKEKVQGNGWDQ